ncbi:methyltransferase [Mesomycoplasma ovipneumoniae]|uniref:tRNA1(Val) (adenine(37)-N6)-methyltransferase n=1 Tax=Mesomycoplasma ovipneumoniae TaxID=29562 RepID=UPI0026E1C288|nr:methyltransferase [Mesomycoplasma ovipneumoniae]MDO6825878.1 methyltransferase [Mesomycoplasma ovipneumoniae]MDO6857335.1 methyltransferase [Mesomycoplasma ovipneumoniae]
MKNNLELNNLGYNDDLKIWQDKASFNYSVDTILLGNFITLTKKVKLALEIGTNNGALAIFVAHRKKDLIIDAIEINEKAINLAKTNVEINKKESQINLICADFNQFWVEHNKKQSRKYDLIFANPPYFKVGTKKIRNVSPEFKNAIYEFSLNLSQLILGASKIIQDKGRLSLVLPIERFIDVIEFLRQGRFEPKRVQFVMARVGSSPKFVLIESDFNAQWGTQFLHNLYLHPNNKNEHVYRKEIQKLYVARKVKNG